jgi:hypothetical protein
MMTDRFELRLAPELLDRLEQWRQRQPAVPSKASAVRYIMELGLTAAEKADAPHKVGSGSGSTRKPRSTGKSAGRAR